MPDKWPLANGNWSNAANWNGGTKPVAGDDVFADGRTIAMDEDPVCASIRTTQRSGGTIGGVFNVTANRNIPANIIAGSSTVISATTAIILNITGTVTASATANAISSTNANGQVYLNGNMVNNNGKMAIYAPIVWLDRTGTTTASFFTSGGVARTLYSENTVPNTPAANNVRSGTIYGAGNSLVGTIVMPVAANVRNGVTYDNGTVGTALFTTSLFITELSASTVPVAVRMQNLCTPMILGELMEAFKK
jgi:hypothetical protein